MPLLRASLALAALAMASAASAQDGEVPGSMLNVETGVGTLGFTVGSGWRVSDQFALRGVIGQGSFSYDDTVEGDDYSGEVDAFGLGVLADYYPFGSGLRLTGGAFLPEYDASLVGRGVTIGPTTSDIEVSISDRSTVAPAIAVGFGGTVGRRVRISGDLGAMYVGGFDISARDPSGTFSQAQIDGEISDLRDDLGGTDFIPYASFSIGMSF